MCAIFDAGHLTVLLTGLVQTLVTVDVDQGQLLLSHTHTHTQRTRSQRVCQKMADWITTHLNGE